MKSEMKKHDVYGPNIKKSFITYMLFKKQLMKTTSRNLKAADFNVGFAYEWNLVNDRIEWYGNIHEKLGYQQAEFPTTFKEWEKIIHRDDYGRIKTSIYLQLKTGEIYFEKYRLKRKDGSLVCVMDTGTCVRNYCDTPYKWTGVMQLSESM